MCTIQECMRISPFLNSQIWLVFIFFEQRFFFLSYTCIKNKLWCTFMLFTNRYIIFFEHTIRYISNISAINLLTRHHPDHHSRSSFNPNFLLRARAYPACSSFARFLSLSLSLSLYSLSSHFFNYDNKILHCNRASDPYTFVFLLWQLWNDWQGKKTKRVDAAWGQKLSRGWRGDGVAS